MKESFVILGARGTLPVAGGNFEKYGGHTTCFSLQTGQGLIIIDAGTGLSLVKETKEEQSRPATLFFTHFHLDHIMALPFFSRIYNAGSALTLMADPARKPDWRSSLTNLFTPPYWPVTITSTAAGLEFKDLPSGAAGIELYGVRVAWCPVWHPQGCLAYRLETAGRSVAVVTDHECGDARLDEILLRFCARADFLVYDAQYTPEELKTRRGWGHSSWEEGVKIAARAKVGELILTHHDYKRGDDEIDAIVKNARRRFPNTSAATDNLALF